MISGPAHWRYLPRPPLGYSRIDAIAGAADTMNATRGEGLRAVPRRVVVTLILTILLALSVAFRVWGQEEELRGLEVQAVSMCRNLDHARAPCILLSRYDEADVVWVAIFSHHGTEVQTIIRHDLASGKQAVVWPKAVPDPSAAHAPRGK